MTALADSGGTLQASYIYDPYGRHLAGAGALLTSNVMRFSSKPWVSSLSSSATTGLYYYGYRFYDPYSQRWLNRDPLPRDESANLYFYVANSPLWLADAHGLSIIKDRRKDSEEALKKALEKIKDWLELGKSCKEILDQIKEGLEKGKLPGAAPGGALGGILGTGGLPAGAVSALEAFVDSPDCQSMLGCCKAGNLAGCEEKAAGCALDLGMAVAGSTSSAMATSVAEILEGVLVRNFAHRARKRGSRLSDEATSGVRRKSV